MKQMNKILALALALIMILGLATTASAANIENLSSHTFEAYQILTGTQAESEGALGDVAWGTGINPDSFIAALKEDAATKTAFGAVADAKSFAEELAKHADKSDIANAVARIAYASKTDVKVSVAAGSENKLADGYYLIVDVTDVDGDHDAKNAALLQVTDDITIEVKTDKPTSQKKVKDINDSGDAEIEDNAWQDSADHDIGDAVPFQLTATLPNNVTSYNKYYLAFHDVQSAGLTFNANSVKVFVNGTQINNGYTVNAAPTDGCTFEIIIQDVRAAAVGAGNGSVITVEYTSTLNENAVLGSAGNPNSMHIEYSNNPNQVVEGEEKPETGKTPDDKVIVFTYKVVANKYANEVKDGNELVGAGFTLYKWDVSVESDDKWVAVGTEVKGDALTTFEWKGLDDGNYKLEETTTPAGYNTIAPIEFTVTAEHEVLSDNPALTSLTGEATSGEITFTPNITENDASLSTDIINQAGTVLPETGGMGTILFYALGGLLVAAAVVLLVTKKRMASAE